MAYAPPGNQTTGQFTVYVAPYGTVIPSVNQAPLSPWALLGTTDGIQSIVHPGILKYFRTHDRIGPDRAVRDIMDVIIEFTLPKLDPTEYARVLGQIENLETVGGITKIPLKREYYPFEYSMMVRGRILSKYGALPGMYVIPRGVFDGEPRVLMNDDGSESLQVVFRALEDYEQEEDYGLGWMELKSS